MRNSKKSFLVTVASLVGLQLILILLCPISLKAQSNPASYWVGFLKTKDTVYYVKLLIDSTSCKLHIPQLGLIRKSVQSFSFLNNNIDFSVEHGKQLLHFKGRVNTNQLQATITGFPKEGRAKLFSYKSVLKNQAEAISGTYRLKDGSYILAETNGDGIEILNLNTGKKFICWQTSENHFTSILPLHEERGELSNHLQVFIDSTGILLKETNQEGETISSGNGIKYDLCENTDIIINSDTVKIAGTLKRSKLGSSKQPMVVIVPGAGYIDRNGYNKIITYFTSIGYSVFSYDKRGIGQSTGNKNENSFEALSSDVVCIINELSKYNSIDTENILLWGHSQGGWLASMIANKTDKVSGTILVSSPTDKPGIQTSYWVERYLTTKNFSSGDVKAATDWMRLIVQVMNEKGKGYETVEAKLPEVKTKPWSDFVTVPNSKEDLLNWEGYYFDPVSELQKISVPVLAIYGGLDINVNAVDNSKKMRVLLGGKNKYNHVEVFDGTDHDIMLCSTGNRDLDTPFEIKGFTPGYLKLLRDWTKKIIK